MTIRNLNFFFQPKSIALVGASERPGSIGLHMAENMLRAGFQGPIGFVNLHRSSVLGKICYSSPEALPFTPELAVVATPPRAVPGAIAALGRKGCRAAVVITAGVTGNLARQMQDAARPYLLRIIGPNCLGIQVPYLNLDASFAQTFARRGDIALVSQSGALTTAMLDWATVEGVGFSHVVSIGDATDVDLGDMLDYLAGEVMSRAVFLYIEGIAHAAKFMSAARRCSRSKPVIAIKSGRHPEGAKAALSHTGALAGSDAVFSAALRRAGILRVLDLHEMFESAEVISRVKSVAGSRLAIITNGGGTGVLAADTLADVQGTLTHLGEKTIRALDAVLPPTWSRGNPVDVIGDAPPERYAAAIKEVMRDPNTDAVLVMHVPTALVPSSETAKATVEAVREGRKAGSNKPVLASWLERSKSAEVKPLFREAKIPDFVTPGAAVRGIMQLARYGVAQAELMQTPPALPAEMRFNSAAVDADIAQVLKEGRKLMTEPEAKTVLEAYDIPTVPTRVAATPEEARRAAEELLRSYSSLVVKILSPDITHKSDVGGVRLDLKSAEYVEKVTRQMLSDIAALRPDAKLQGVTVQPRISRSNAYELLLGITTDSTFGPIIVFGAGGTAVEAIGDTAMALTPLDLKLAMDLIESTRVYQLLKGFRGNPPVDLEGLAFCLVKLSSLAVQHPAIRSLDINPLLASEKRLLALDARIEVEDPALAPATPPAIRPYPIQWETREKLLTGEEVFIRPIRPDDEPMYLTMMSMVTPEDIRMRLLMPVREFSHQFLARMTQIDYAREMAFIALRCPPGAEPEMLGVVRFFADPDYEKAEYAVLARSDYKGKGLGWVLMRHLIRYARAERLKSLYGTVLKENATMLQMCRELGFEVKRDPDDAMLFAVTLDIKGEAVTKLLAQS